VEVEKREERRREGRREERRREGRREERRREGRIEGSRREKGGTRLQNDRLSAHVDIVAANVVHLPSSLYCHSKTMKGLISQQPQPCHL
jgi:hypothetical protein